MNLTTPFQVAQWLDQLRRLEKDNRCNCPSFLRPFHFVTLGLTVARGRMVDLGIPKPLETYAARMQLWQAIGLPAPVVVQPYVPEGRFMPLARVESEDNVSDLAERLAEITAKYGADKDTRNAVSVSMIEIMGNCLAHAEVNGQLKGVVCAQSWPQGNLAQIAIADSGIGIRSSLEANSLLHEALEGGNSCEIATRLGVTSKPELGHAGYGLALTRQLLERAGGRLIVISGDEWMEARKLACKVGKLQSPWPGTIAVLEWRTNVPMRLKDVYESWPLPKGFTDEDFNL